MRDRSSPVPLRQWSARTQAQELRPVVTPRCGLPSCGRCAAGGRTPRSRAPATGQAAPSRSVPRAVLGVSLTEQLTTGFLDLLLRQRAVLGLVRGDDLREAVHRELVPDRLGDVAGQAAAPGPRAELVHQVRWHGDGDVLSCPGARRLHASQCSTRIITVCCANGRQRLHTAAGHPRRVRRSRRPAPPSGPVPHARPAAPVREDGPMPNRLSHETSPYLLQHADNPVDWWPWTREAFDEARERGVPVLLSVGYASCHWCHVMAHESFEDGATAAYLNEHFVSVKVDREERPDVDAVYMEAVQAATGQGGWPMTVFMTAEGEPFYFGTYFPPEPRHGMPSFRQVLEGVTAAWTGRRDEVDEVAARIRRDLAGRSLAHGGDGVPGAEEQARALIGLSREYDERHGGFGGAPKFPPSMVLEFLLRHHARTGSEANPPDGRRDGGGHG
ncbi:conserved hypothetical protein, partial [Streptomyces clavuligerus]